MKYKKEIGFKESSQRAILDNIKIFVKNCNLMITIISSENAATSYMLNVHEFKVLSNANGGKEIIDRTKPNTLLDPMIKYIDVSDINLYCIRNKEQILFGCLSISIIRNICNFIKIRSIRER